MKVMYPVIFTQTEDCFLIEVPDLDILTEGTDMENAIDMARDAISITVVTLEDSGEIVPGATPLENVDVSKGTFAGNGKSFTSIVDANITEYRRKVDTKPVRRNVSLPSWLNYEAEAQGINVSRVLQEALIDTLKNTKRA